MKILHISYCETNAGWGAECFVDRALKQLGEEVIELDFKKHNETLCEKILDCGDFDLLFLQRGDFFPIEILKCVNRPKVFWASELISRCRDQDRLFYCNEFSHIFVHSKECERILLSRLQNKHRLLPEIPEGVSCLLNGYDEQLHKRLNRHKDIDVLFVGSVTERRRKVLEKLGRKVNITVRTRVFGKDFVELINKSKIVLNIHASKRLDTETRIFEVLGSGAFLISETLSEENPFVPGEHYVECDINNFADKIRYYLENNEARNKIAEAGYEEAVAKHSYLKRTEYEILPALRRHVEVHNNGNAVNRDNLLKYNKERKRVLYRIKETLESDFIKARQKLANKLNA